MDEADPGAAEAGLGVQALLGLAAGNSGVRLPSLAGLGQSHHQPPPGGPPAFARAAEPHAFADRAPPSLLDARQFPGQPGPPLPPSFAHSAPEHVGANAPPPRLPPVSAPVPPALGEQLPPPLDPSAHASGPVPRLASISEWAPTGPPSLLGQMQALPRLHQPHPLQSVPSLPAMPVSQPATSAHAWGQPIPGLLPQFPQQQGWPSPPPLLYSYAPQHPQPMQAEAPAYYYGGHAHGPHYPHMGPTQLPKLHAQPAPLHVPQYVGALPHLDRHQASQTQSHGSGHSLPPILNGMNGVMKESTDETPGRCASDLMTTAILSVAGRETKPPALPNLSVPSSSSDGAKIKLMRKNSFAGPSSGRSLVDLMNPTDTLASVAASVAPMVTDDRRPAAAPSKGKGVSALAHDLFGTGTSLPTGKTEVSSPLRRKKQPAKDESVPGDRDQSLSSSFVSPSADASMAEKENKPRYSAKDSSPPMWEKTNGDSENKKASTAQRTGEGDHPSPTIADDSDDSASVVSSDSEITRCPCGSSSDSGTMIACDQCNTWQHRICMGFRRKSDVPRMYFCHLCKPGEMRPNCVAHPKFKERQLLKHEDDRCEPILLSVKPVELRKRFSADLKAKQNGSRPLVYPDVFLKYAALYRTQFGKDRQSVLEGLVVLTELSRRQVLKRLESAIKKTKMAKKSGPGRPSSHDERGDRRRQEYMSMDTSVGMNGPAGQSKSSGQKRGRPSPSTPENMPDSERGGPSNPNASPEKELSARERARMSREERKVMQEMALFARLEERDKKKPRLGEASGSPRVPSVPSPQTTAANSSSRLSFSIKSPSRMSTSPEPSAMRSPASPVRDGQKLPLLSKLAASPSPPPGDHAVPNPSTAPAKRERSKDRKDRRREVRISSNLPGDSGRRSAILPRRKERQVLSVSRQRKSGKSEGYGSGTLSAKCIPVVRHVPGPSVLRSGLTPRHERSTIDSAVDDVTQKEQAERSLGSSRRLSKKAWLLAGAPGGGDISTTPRPVSYPSRKRLAHRYVNVSSNDSSTEPDASMPNVIPGISNTENLGVSMVVVSKREALPDGGKGLEKFLAPGSGPADVLSVRAEDDSLSRCVFTVKKRTRLRGSEKHAVADESDEKDMTDIPGTSESAEGAVKAITFSVKKRFGRGAKGQLSSTEAIVARDEPSPMQLDLPSQEVVSKGTPLASPAKMDISDSPTSTMREMDTGSSAPVRKPAKECEKMADVEVAKAKTPVPASKPSSKPSGQSSPAEVSTKKKTASAASAASKANAPNSITVGASMGTKVRSPPPALPNTVFFSGMRRKSASPPPALPKTVFVKRGSPPALPLPAFSRDAGATSRHRDMKTSSRSAGPSSPKVPVSSPKVVVASSPRAADHGKAEGVVQRKVRPLPTAFRSAPAPVPGSTGLRSSKPVHPAAKSTASIAIPRSAPPKIPRSAPPRSISTPPPLRSAPVASVPKAVAANGVGWSDSQMPPIPRTKTNGHSVPEGRVHDVLQSRLQQFVHRNSAEVAAPSSRLPRRSPMASPRARLPPPTTQFSRDLPNVWKNEPYPQKRVHAPSGGSLTPSPPTSGRYERNGGRNTGLKYSDANGRPSANGSPPEEKATTPWSQFRAQNGWSHKSTANGSSKHGGYGVSVPSGADKNKNGNGANGRRRPPYNSS